MQSLLTSMWRRKSKKIGRGKDLLREKQVDKQEEESDLWRMGSRSHLADKAGKALQVSPAPLLCKWAPIKQAAPSSGSPPSLLQPPPSLPQPLAARRKAQPTPWLLQLLAHSHSLFSTRTAWLWGLLNLTCVLARLSAEMCASPRNPRVCVC